MLAAVALQLCTLTVARGPAAATGSDASPAFRFSSAYSDGMVLQSRPQQAIVWGLCPPGDVVTVEVAGEKIAATTQEYGGNSTWTAVLPAMPASFDGQLVTATSAKATGNRTITLSVLFGDVWVCSGQSNMAYGLEGVNDSKAEAETMNQTRFEHIRLFKVAVSGQATPQIEVAARSQGWQQPCPQGKWCDTGFSAVCWLFARDISLKLDPPRPLGMIETNVGGTPDEKWSSPDALAHCNLTSNNPHDGRSSLWNGMVVPLLNTTIKGAIWYQGEANSGNPLSYNCSFPEMITVSNCRSCPSVLSQFRKDTQRSPVCCLSALSPHL